MKEYHVSRFSAKELLTLLGRETVKRNGVSAAKYATLIDLYPDGSVHVVVSPDMTEGELDAVWQNVKAEHQDG